MALFGNNGFIRKQEIAFARKLLVWKYEKAGVTLPNDKALTAHAEKVVAEAHIIAKKSGTNLLDIIKASVKDIKNKTM